MPTLNGSKHRLGAGMNASDAAEQAHVIERDVLEVYGAGLIDGSVIPPQVAIGGDTIGAAASAAKSAIDKTSVVLAHSIVDDVVTECCELSALLMPENWIPSVERRMVSLADVRSKPSDQISQEMLTDFVGQLGQQSLLKRVDILNQKYQPAPAFRFELQPYRFDPDRLEQIDKHRQRIIHQLELAGADENAVEDDLRYLEATCFYFIFIVASKHGISVDPLQDALDSLAVRASTLINLAYEELLLATSLPADGEQIWSFGGSVFAQDAKRRTRQLPLLMPAGTPDLSSDRRRIVFVKYRPRAGDDPPYSGHLAGRETTVAVGPNSTARGIIEGWPSPSGFETI